MNCAEVRPRLGELLTGALDPNDMAEVGLHLVDCPDCTDEFAALGSLETLLRTAPPAQLAKPSPGGMARLMVAAVLIAALALGLLLGRPAPLPAGRLVRGTLRGGLEPGDTLPTGARVHATTPSLVAVGTRAAVELSAGTSLVVEGDETVRLTSGSGVFRVTPGDPRFVVHTPRGRVSVLGTTFRVSIEETPMSSKKTGLAAGVVVVAVVSGVVLFEPDDGGRPARLESGQAIVAGPDGAVRQTVALEAQPQAPQQAEVTRLQAENERLRAERDQLVATRAELEARLATVERDRSAPVEVVEPAVPEGQAPGVAFGEYAELEPLRTADWKRMAQASNTIADLLDDVLEQLAAGTGVDAETRLRLASENQALLSFAMAISGKLPTHAPGNGEYTHPVVMSNMMLEGLAQRGEPLGKGQQDELSRLGEEYEAAWERAQASYDDQTLMLEKVLDELRLKQTFTDQVRASLSPAQLSALGPGGARDRVQLDLFSPALLLSTVSAAVPAPRAELAARLQKQAGASWGLSSDVLVGAEQVFESWVSSLGEGLVEVEGATVALFTSQDALAAGRAQLEATHELLRILPLEPEARQRIHGSRLLLVPRLLASK